MILFKYVMRDRKEMLFDCGFINAVDEDSALENLRLNYNDIRKESTIFELEELAEFEDEDEEFEAIYG